MDHEILYLLLIFALLVIPRMLQRFKIPAPLTCLFFGISATWIPQIQIHDPALPLLSIFGISSLFLFAGLDVDMGLLRKSSIPLIGYLLTYAGLLFAAGWVVTYYWHFSWQETGLLMLALFTPSTGFIVDSLKTLALDDDERLSIINIAVAGEMFALVGLFIIQQSANPTQMLKASGYLFALLVVLPFLFVAMGRWVVAHAPGSEFSLLVMVGLIAAYATYELGVYYLVGAFIAGLVARLLRQRMPLLASDENLHAVSLFASFFVPFYFFKAGTSIPVQAFSLASLGLGVALTAGIVPIRFIFTWLQRKLFFRDSNRSSTRVSIALTPTLVFTLVMASLLHERFHIPDVLYGGLILYAALTTLMPYLWIPSVTPAATPAPPDTAAADTTHTETTLANPSPPSQTTPNTHD